MEAKLLDVSGGAAVLRRCTLGRFLLDQHCKNKSLDGALEKKGEWLVVVTAVCLVSMTPASNADRCSAE